MQVPDEIMNSWLSLRCEGDTKEIADAAGVTINVVQNMFREKKCSERVFTAASIFFAKRIALVHKAAQALQISHSTTTPIATSTR